MKKAFVIGGIVAAAMVVALLALPLLFLNSIIKAGFETVGPKVAKVETRLDAASVSLFSGAGQLKGVFVGNPEGFKSPAAIQVGEVSLALEPRSVFASKIVIKSIKVAAPEITVEGVLKGNNLMKILDNVQSVTGSSSSASDAPKPTAEAGGKKLQIDDFSLTGGKVNLTLGGPGAKSISLALPDIRFSGLGQGAEGITPAEVTERMLKELMARVTPLIAENIGKLGQDAVNAATQKAVEAAAEKVGQERAKQLENVTKGIGDLLKKK